MKSLESQVSAMSSDANSKQGSLEASLAQLDSEKKQVIKEKEEVRVTKYIQYLGAQLTHFSSS